jgi:uncharacterized protein (TIGR00304 family)
MLLVLVFVAISLARSGGVKGRGGAVVIIGPFPIIFGTDKQSAKILLVLSIILVGALIALFLVQGYF